MSTNYTIIQYVPDATADERINIGVITWDRERVYSKFITDWSRARSFGGQNIAFLKEFADHVAHHTNDPHHNQYAEFAPDSLETLIINWRDSIQFTEPRGSIRSPAELIQEIPSKFLRGHQIPEVPDSPAEVERTARSRAAAIREAYNCAIGAAKARAPDAAKNIVKKHGSLPGKYNTHHFDVVLANGSLFGAVSAISFEIPNRVRLQDDIDATAWRIDDVRMNPKAEGLPIAVYIFPPREDDLSPVLERATKAFRGLKANVIKREQDMVKWADIRIQEKVGRQ